MSEGIEIKNLNIIECPFCKTEVKPHVLDLLIKKGNLYTMKLRCDLCNIDYEIQGSIIINQIWSNKLLQ